MIKPSVAWSKVRKDLALNLSELAIVSGYDRGVLAKMVLPLQAGKLSLSDFRRIMRMRQDRDERSRSKLRIAGKPASSPPANVVQREATADRFYAPSPKRGGKAASRPAQESQLRNTA